VFAGPKTFSFDAWKRTTYQNSGSRRPKLTVNKQRRWSVPGANDMQKLISKASA
jgi:hypothetical protein